MAQKRKKRWAVSVGVKGQNRVRVYEHINRRLYLQWTGGSEPLATADRLEAVDLAKVKAESLLRKRRGELVLGELFDNYLDEVAKPLTNYKQRKRTFTMMRSFWGPNLIVANLDHQDIHRYLDARRTGKVIPPKGRAGCRDRVLEEELAGLVACLNWATTLKDKVTGEFKLQNNPIRGFKLPREKNPVRPVLDTGEYDAILAVADQIDQRFKVALVLCYETGHRVGSVRQLKWSDIDLEGRKVRWDGSTQKNGYTHYTPLSDAAVAVLEVLPRGRDADPLLPSTRDPSKPLVREVYTKWWAEARTLAKLPNKTGGWHQLRRAFATELLDQPVKVVQELGGWKDPQVLTQIYQTVSLNQLRSALNGRKVVKNP